MGKISAAEHHGKRSITPDEEILRCHPGENTGKKMTLSEEDHSVC
ncbi:MAG TPA: hypothetical protein VHB01_03690 [Nitrosospira sp.]|nr:hypothetical protein [Nitrosospira sp.]